MQMQTLEAEAQRGVAALQRGDFAEARDAFSTVTASGAATPQSWLFLAQACEGLADFPAAASALDHVLASDPGNPFVLLMKGDIHARDGDDRASVSFYRMGLRRAAELDQLPGDLPDRVRKAEAAVAAAEARFEAQLERTLAERGIRNIPQRFAEALAIASGKQPVYLQQPTSFYFPGLPQMPWYPRDMFPWVAELEKAVPEMRAEVERALADQQGIEPYVQEEAKRASRGHSLLNDASWSAFHLYKGGERVEENAARCPLIMRLLEVLPIPVIKHRSPMALVSILKPGTHIPPHHG
ncbi:MAG: aspartyl/asparaginyl beta-hydroxylase domain-containing protein, partial [Sphingomonas sp.]|nr:aspartyl/asparaginyl beta-hydroxylase domain-containing protein [Sphingomonas sp.]